MEPLTPSTGPDQDSTLAAALTYAAAGWCVLPVWPDKTPHIEGWPELATDNPEVIRSWWTKWPDTDVAILTGCKSGIVVVDVDPRNGGKSEDISTKTLIAQTRSGGTHHYYRANEPIRSRKLAKGIDLKSERGYVIAPPTPGYTWSGGDLVNAPEDWLRRLTALPVPQGGGKTGEQAGSDSAVTRRVYGNPQNYAQSALDSAAMEVATAHQGTRNDTLNRQTYKIARMIPYGYLTDSEVWQALESAAETTHLPSEQILSTLHNAITAGKQRPIKLETYKLVNTQNTPGVWQPPGVPDG